MVLNLGDLVRPGVLAVLAIAGTEAIAETHAVTAEQCTSISALKLTHVSIDSAEVVVSAEGESSETEPLPDYCRVAATANPSEDSDIKFEVWLPMQGWNGKFNQGAHSGLRGQPFQRHADSHSGVRGQSSRGMLSV